MEQEKSLEMAAFAIARTYSRVKVRYILGFYVI